MGVVFSILTNKFTIMTIAVLTIVLAIILISQEAIDTIAFFVMLGIGVFLLIISIMMIVAGRRRATVPTLLPEGVGTPLEQVTNAIDYLNRLIKRGDRSVVPPTGVVLPFQPIA